MTAVTRVLPRYWDSQRLLRFLTGLAMLALAFTVHLPPAAEPVTPSAVVAEAASPVSSALSAAQPAVQPASQPEAVPAEPIRPVLPPAVPAILGAAVVLVAGFALRVRVERAPPTA